MVGFGEENNQHRKDSATLGDRLRAGDHLERVGRHGGRGPMRRKFIIVPDG